MKTMEVCEEIEVLERKGVELPAAEREIAEIHVRGCVRCREELAWRTIERETLTSFARADDDDPLPAFELIAQRLENLDEGSRGTAARAIDGAPQGPVRRIGGKRWAAVALVAAAAAMCLWWAEQRSDPAIHASAPEVSRDSSGSESAGPGRLPAQTARAIPSTRVPLAERPGRAKDYPRDLTDDDMAAIDPDGSPSEGPARAPVTLVVFTDFEGPFPHRFEITLAELRLKYPTELRVVHKMFPLAKHHPHARDAARFALAADEVGRFPEFRDELLVWGNDFDRADLEDVAANVGLEGDAFLRLVDAPATGARVDAETALAERLGVRAVPMSYVNGLAIEGALSTADFARVIDGELGRPAR